MPPLAAPDPLAAPTWALAIATMVLAVGAIVTALFAVLAWRNQSAEVHLQREEIERTAADRRRAQAARVYTWYSRMRAAPGPGNAEEGVRLWPTLHIKNSSDQPVYGLIVDWYFQDRINLSRPLIPGLTVGEFMPGQEIEREPPPSARKLPAGHADDLLAEVRFRDAAGYEWLRTKDGNLVQQDDDPSGKRDHKRPRFRRWRARKDSNPQPSDP
jgi:hypothetical protein